MYSSVKSMSNQAKIGIRLRLAAQILKDGGEERLDNEDE